jgi:hypothetical protein
MNFVTKAIYIIVIVTLLTVIVIRRNQPRSGYFLPGTLIDDVPLQSVMDGAPTRLSDVLDGKPAALHIFSTSCGVCMREWPKLKTLHATYGHDMKLVPIGMDSLGNLKALETRRPLGTSTYRGGRKARNAMPVPHYPFTLFVDENLRLIRDHSGVLGHKAYAAALKSWRNKDLDQSP